MPHPAGTEPTASAGVVVRLTSAQLEQLAEEKVRLEEERAKRLDLLGESLAKKRSEAIAARQALGIDEQWREDLEFYEGIDDANRGEMDSWRSKPPGQSMPSSIVRADGDVRSTVFVNITRPYCDAASARMADMLMPTDDRAFAIEPTPIPELDGLAKGRVSLAVRQSIASQVRTEEEAHRAVADLMQKAAADMATAKERAERAQKRIDDWFVECQYHAEIRKVLDDAARIGTGVLKGPVPVRRKSMKVLADAGEMRLVLDSKIAPASKRINPLNFFPHGACGENIHNGSYVWERDFVTAKTLEGLKETPGYIATQINKCLEEGPQKATGEAPLPHDIDLKDSYEIWYYHGTLDTEDFEAMGCQCEMDESGERPKTVYAIVTMVNNRVIKGALNPLDTGDFPYDVMVWQRRSGCWAGIGVARQIRTPQRMVNAATRNMMDNAGLSSGPQIVMKLGVVRPADGHNTLSPRKFWYVQPDADVNDLNAVFRSYNIDSKQTELMSIIQFGLKVAEDVTGLPLLLQGQQGKAPETVGGMQILNNNSSTVLRRLAKMFDDGITEPHVRRYYVWLMQYGDDSEKGDFQINARGSSALVERELQNQAIVQMGNIVLNPAFGVDPKKWFAEYSKSQRLDPKRFQYSEEEQNRIDAMAAQGPTDPRLAVAQIRAQVETQLAQFEHQTKERLLLLEQQFEREQRQYDRELELIVRQVEQSGKKSISLDELRTRLADTAIKVRAQRDLSAQSNAVALQTRSIPKAVTPPTEPAGQAPAGQAYQR